MNAVGKKERSNLYLNAEIKEKAKEILSRYGLSLSEAVNIFLTQVVLEKGIPFRIQIPNETTRKAMEEVRKGKNLEETSFSSLASEVKQSVKS
jgi:DNA-damage-inducible protein J